MKKSFQGIAVFGLILIGAFSQDSAMAADPQGLSSEFAAGVVLTGGNTETLTINLNETTKYIWSENQFRFEGRYLRSSNRGIEQAYQWGLGLRYERELSSKLSLFLGQIVESNRYQNILQRYSTDLGAKHHFDRSEVFKWYAELGYRFTRENYFGSSKNFSFVRFYNEFERFFTKTSSAKLWIEYLPNVTTWKAYQLNTELSLNTVLTDVFSLKMAYQIRYYNEPPEGTAYKTDSIFTTALVGKF